MSSVTQKLTRFSQIGSRLVTGFDIAEPVGVWEKGARNKPDDVITIQLLLEAAAMKSGRRDVDPMGVDGKISRAQNKSRTVKAIRRFQGQHMKSPDGLVEPGKQTLEKLREATLGLPLTSDAKASPDVARGVQSSPLYSGFGQVLGPPAGASVPADLWQVAMRSLNKHRGDERLKKPHIVTLVDFRKTAATRRLWTVDLDEGRQLFNEYVTHGRNSGRSGNVAVTDTGNEPGSYKSCVGAFITDQATYRSKAGQGRVVNLATGDEAKVAKHARQRKTALRIDGLDPTNDNTRRRAIVFHGAWYISERRIRRGSIGRSQGCFATEQSVNDRLVDAIVGGSFVYAYRG